MHFIDHHSARLWPMALTPLDRIAALARILGHNYAEAATRLQSESQYRDALLEVQAPEPIEPGTMLGIVAENCRAMEKACARYAQLQDELAQLASQHMPETAKRCPLVRVTGGNGSHLAPQQFDWPNFDRQCRLLEMEAKRK